MLITFVFASLLLQEPSDNAATLSDRVVDATQIMHELKVELASEPASLP